MKLSIRWILQKTQNKIKYIEKITIPYLLTYSMVQSPP